MISLKSLLEVFSFFKTLQSNAKIIPKMFSKGIFFDIHFIKFVLLDFKYDVWKKKGVIMWFVQRSFLLRFWNFKSSLMFSWYHKTFHVKRYVRLHKGTISGILHIFYTYMVKSLRAIFRFRAQWSAINFCKYFVT